MTRARSDRLLWAITALVAVALAVVTVLFMRRAGLFERLAARAEQSRPSEVARIPGEEDVPQVEETVVNEPKLTPPTPTAVPAVAERLFFIASDPEVPEEELAGRVHLWTMPATGGDAEMVAEEVRAHGFGDLPPWCLVDGGDEPWLIYILGPEESMRLMALDLRRGESKELYEASSGDWIGSPSASPDGQRLAFITVEAPPGGEFDDGSEGTLHVLRMADGEMEQEFDPTTLWTPLAWSPDSQWLAAVESGGSFRWPRLLLLPAGEGEVVEPPFTQGLQAAWEPEGQRMIAVRGQNSGGFELLAWDVAAGRHEPLVLEGEEAGQNLGVVWNLAWSPDGLWLLGLAGDDWGDFNLYAVRRDEGQPVSLYGEGEDQGSVWWHDWSPDGRHIAFMGSYATGDDEGADGAGGFVIQPDGNDLWQVDAGLEGQVVSMAWSPDGQRLAFALRGGEDLSSQLYVVDRDERRPELLHEGLGYYFYLLWLPAVGGET